MKVLVLGSGGREHAICWKLAQSSILESLYTAPGNAGTSQFGENVDLSVMDFDAIRDFVIEKKIDILVVGPEDPLVEGIHDYFEDCETVNNLTVIGPNKKAAQLEGSKDFAKKFMKRHNIPTAKYESFTKSSLRKGHQFLESMKAPYVLKCDGLAAGKGVLIIEDLEEAKQALTDILSNKKFGEAGTKVVIEEFLDGLEVSMFVITDGDAFKLLPEAKDYKRIGEGDTGLNTGGMGAVSPVPFVSREFMEKIKSHIIVPTMKGLKADGLNYQGFLFFGLIKVNGDPFVIEYNVRLGDPETEVIIPRIKSDLLHFFDGIASTTLSECDLEIDEKAATTLMLVSGGYPESYEKGKEIKGLGDVKDSIVFHAGTTRKGDKTVTSGGRVIAVTSMAANIENALAKSYESAKKIKFDKMYYRTDLGEDLKKVNQKVRTT